MVLALGGMAEASACATPILGCAPPPTTSTPSPADPTTTTTTTPPPSTAAAQARLAELVNSERTSRGLGPLQVRADVTAIASGWSDSMAQSATLSHDDAYFTDASHRQLGAQLLGENVARAPDIDVAHKALMASEHHRDNILDGRFSVIGIGATFVDGTWWITEDFLQPRAVTAPRHAGPVVRGHAHAAAPQMAAPSTSTSTTVTTSAVEIASVVAVAAEPARSVAVLPRLDHVELSAVSTTGGAPRARRDLAVVAAALVLALASALRRQLRRR
jgi:uncharacterized protein YkwD